jgi:hypothetical protein
LPWVFGQAFSRGFFVHLVAHSAAAAKRHIHSLRPIRLIFTASIDFSARRCERIRNPLRAEALGERIRTLKPPARGRPRRPCHCDRCQSARRDRWSGVLRINRGTAGPLDRVAQIAERKYCRPQARPFRLGFPRKVPVFPICPPAAL